MKMAAKKKNKLTSSKPDRKVAGKGAKNSGTKSPQKKKNVAQKGKIATARATVAAQKPKPRNNSHGRRPASSAASTHKPKVTVPTRNMGMLKKGKVVARKASTQAKVVKEKVVKDQKKSASNAVSRIAIAKSEGRALDVEKKINGIRNEFKKTLKAEVAAAFDVCLAAMEQTVNLMESRLATMLGEMSNLVTGSKPTFKGGKLDSVVSEDGKEKTTFSYGRDGLVTSRTYRDGKLKFEIVHGKLGNPLHGKMFGSSGEVEKEFSYGPDGQVK